MDTLFINAKYDGKVELDNITLSYCKKYKKIAVYTSVQFTGKIDKVISQLKEAGVEVITSRPDRAFEDSQLLGCDVYYDNLKLKNDPDAFLYIGDGQFHPQSLALAQRNNKVYKEVICFDPIAMKKSLIDIKDVKDLLKKYRGSLIKFLAFETIGVIISTKPGQEKYNEGKKLIKKYPDKNIYFFLDNNIDVTRFEDFPYIKSWVNTACPRIGFDEINTTPIPILNIRDALEAKEILSKKNFLIA
ncbi:MAG: diphthamide synthesis protein [Candidatus Woesearchaeota archaeon]